ncbi:hypothetical protein ACFL0D_06060 [Thermoproteota archaeon]
MLVLFVLLLFTLGYGIFEFSKNKSDLLVNHAIAGVEKCGCSKCHTVELNGCVGCHNSQQGKRKSNESESIAPENETGSHESQSDSADAPGSSPNEPDNDGDQESEMVPNKSKNLKGSAKPNE